MIQGLVSEVDGTPLIGASIVAIGTSVGTISDVDGKFSLEIPDGIDKIMVSYTGFETETIKLKGLDLKKPINVILTEASQLNEIVVISAGKERKKWKRRNNKAAPSPPPAVSETFINSDNVSQGQNRPSGKQVPPVFYNEEVEMEEANYSVIAENEFFNSKKNPLSTLSIDVDRASYSNMRRFLQGGSLPPVDAVRVEELINYFEYDYDAPKMSAKRPFNTNSTLTACPWNEDHELLHISLQGAKMDRDEIPSSNFVFLIDVSGSMNSADKLPLLKSAFKLFVNQLDEKDRVAIVVYAGSAGCVLESTAGSDKAKIIESLDRLSAGGSTAGAAGIQQAYKIAKKNFIKGGNNRVILATDGDFNVGTSGDDALVKLIEEKRKSDIFLSILAFGTGNYMDGKMQKIADAGNGNHSYIDNMQEAKKVLMEEFGGTMFTIAKDVKIQIEFNPELVESYRMVGYENRVLAAEDFNDDTKDAGEMGAGHSVTVLYEIIKKGSNSSFSKRIDPLKYQSNEKVASGSSSKELATIKYRFKKADSDKSTKSEEIIVNNIVAWNKVDQDILWAAYVAEFGLMLRNSSFAVDANYDDLIRGLKKADNKNKYRMEFIDLVEIAESIDTRFVASTNED